jgi:hypothetical protein
MMMSKAIQYLLMGLLGIISASAFGQLITKPAQSGYLGANGSITTSLDDACMNAVEPIIKTHNLVETGFFTKSICNNYIDNYCNINSYNII